jgi:hypothetical protein
MRRVRGLVGADGRCNYRHFDPVCENRSASRCIAGTSVERPENLFFVEIGIILDEN